MRRVMVVSLFLEEWHAWEILQRLYRQYSSVRKLTSLLGVSKSTIHRVLKNVQAVPLILEVKLCEIIPEERGINTISLSIKFLIR